MRGSDSVQRIVRPTAASARKAKALTVSKLGGGRPTDGQLCASFPRQGGSMANLVQHSRHVSRRSVRRAGFTLIELMIAVAVVAIVAMIAIPSYKAQMVKGRRSSAEAALLDIAQREQQYLLDARGYAYSVAALNTTTPVNVSNYYTITFL